LAAAYSMLIVILEAGDPPRTSNDNWQRAAIVGCPFLFIIGALCAAHLKRNAEAFAIVAIGLVVCAVGWSIVHWDIPVLF